MRSKFKLVALILFFGAVAFVFVKWQSAYSAQLRYDKGEFVASKACEPHVEQPSGCRQQMLATLARAPLSADAFSGMLRIDALRGADETRQRRGEQLLARLGFRSTLAQQLLITSALQRRDFVEVLTRSDALLRRDKLKEQVLPIMIVAAGDRSTREPLIKALARKPEWRLSFMTHPGGFVRPEFRAARVEVLNEMIRRKIPVSQLEVAYAVRALSQAQENASAYQLWKHFRGIEGQNFVVFDPRFRTVAEDQASMAGSEIPFEWLLLKGRGYRAQLRQSTRQNMLNLSWNGRGSPVLLEQKILLTAGRPYQIEINASEPAAVVARRFAITLDCPGRGSVSFADFEPAKAPGKPETMTTAEAVPCAFPVLRIRGNAVDSGDRGGRTSISYLAVSPAATQSK